MNRTCLDEVYNEGYVYDLFLVLESYLVLQIRF